MHTAIVKRATAAAALCFFIPWAVTMAMNGVVTTQISNIGSDIRRVRIDAGKAVMEVSVDDYMAGVLATRLTYGEEAELIKAQAVMVRTEIYRLMQDEICIDDDELSMTYLSEKERKKLWGSEYDEKEELIEDCIASVAGRAITYNGSFIKCPYTAVSAGNTRDAGGLSSDAPQYLQSVKCSRDVESGDYLSIITKSNEDFVKMCNKKFNTSTIGTETGLDKNSPLQSVQIVSRDAAEYVVKVKIGSVVVTGEELADALELASPCFYFEAGSDDSGSGCVKITVKGSGSGYGMSMYEAHRMACDGNNYEEILKYFYNGIVVTDV